MTRRWQQHCDQHYVFFFSPLKTIQQTHTVRRRFPPPPLPRSPQSPPTPVQGHCPKKKNNLLLSVQFFFPLFFFAQSKGAQLSATLSGEIVPVIVIVLLFFVLPKKKPPKKKLFFVLAICPLTAFAPFLEFAPPFFHFPSSFPRFFR